MRNETCMGTKDSEMEASEETKCDKVVQVNAVTLVDQIWISVPVKGEIWQRFYA